MFDYSTWIYVLLSITCESQATKDLSCCRLLHYTHHAIYPYQSSSECPLPSSINLACCEKTCPVFQAFLKDLIVSWRPILPLLRRAAVVERGKITIPGERPKCNINERDLAKGYCCERQSTNQDLRSWTVQWL